MGAPQKMVDGQVLRDANLPRADSVALSDRFEPREVMSVVASRQAEVAEQRRIGERGNDQPPRCWGMWFQLRTRAEEPLRSAQVL